MPRRSRRSGTRPRCSCGAGASGGTSSTFCPTRRIVASVCCPSRTRATSGSTWRATRSTRPRGGSSTCSATATATTPGEVVYDAVWGRDRDGERVAFERFVDWVVERRRRHPGLHVYHYASYERSALHSADGRARHPRAGGGRLPAPGGARRPLPRRQAGAARVGRQLLDQGDREALRASNAPPRCPAATSPSSASRNGSRAGTTRFSRTSSATTRRTAAPPTSCTGGCSGYGRTEHRGALRPKAASLPTRPPPPSTSAKR